MSSPIIDNRKHRDYGTFPYNPASHIETPVIQDGFQTSDPQEKDKKTDPSLLSKMADAALNAFKGHKYNKIG